MRPAAGVDVSQRRRHKDEGDGKYATQSASRCSGLHRTHILLAVSACGCCLLLGVPAGSEPCPIWAHKRGPAGGALEMRMHRHALGVMEQHSARHGRHGWPGQSRASGDRGFTCEDLEEAFYLLAV